MRGNGAIDAELASNRPAGETHPGNLRAAADM
ncbi:unnamed protein product, partial [marine sediment metagenome]